MSKKGFYWEVMAHDYNSPFIRNYIWVRSFFKYPTQLGIPRALFSIASKNDQIEYIGNRKSWTSAHISLKDKATANHKFLNNLIDETNAFGRSFNDWSEKNIYKKDLTKLQGSQLAGLLDDFADKQGTLYAYGTSAAIMDFQGFSFVENNLKKFLGSRLKAKEAVRAFSIFTEPAHNSFAQDQEEALLRMMTAFYANKNWVKDAKSKDLDEIKKLYPSFYRALHRHTEKFSWVYYVYMGPAFTEKQFYAFIQDHLNKKVNPQAKLNSIYKNKQKIKQLRQQLISKLEPDDFNLAILNLAGKLVWGKPRRKDYQSRSYFHLEKLLREISKRLFISLQQARNAPIELLKRGLSGKKIRTSMFDSIQQFHICLPGKKDSVIVLHGKRAANYSKRVKRNTIAAGSGKVRLLKGTCACSGKARGKVKVINSFRDMHKMQYGDILVSAATSPAIVPAIKKASAIITDEGGLTCHAAIVSRELKIPCVVGTGIATAALKDGDTVEVDANRGVVKKIA